MLIRKFTFVIEEAVRRLPNGETRLQVSDFPLSHICLGDFYGLNLQERLTTDYGISSGNDEIEKEYYEEITTIEKVQEEKNVPIQLADWQSGSKLESAERIYRGLNRRAYAMQLWDWYGIPWRFRNDAVYLVWSPRDVMGSPIIRSYPVSDFLLVLAENITKQRSEAEKQNKRLILWKNIWNYSHSACRNYSLDCHPKMDKLNETE